MGIDCHLLPYNYGNLPLLFIWGDFYGNFVRFFITLNSHFGYFPLFILL